MSKARFPETRSQVMSVLERAVDERPSAFIPYPTVVETTHRGERNWDIFSRLLKDRIVFLGTEINDDVANIIIAQFLFPRERGSGQGGDAVHQLPGRRGHQRARDLRHDEHRALPRLDHLPRHGRLDGRRPARGRRTRGTVTRSRTRVSCSTSRSAARAWSGKRHRDPGARDPSPQGRDRSPRSWSTRPASRRSRFTRTSTATSTWARRRPRSTASSTTCSRRAARARKTARRTRSSRTSASRIGVSETAAGMCP